MQVRAWSGWLAVLICLVTGRLPAVDDLAWQNPLPGRETKYLYGETDSTYAYLEYLPGGYDEDPAKEWPLILALHGGARQGPVPWGITAEQIEEDVQEPIHMTRGGRHFKAIILNPVNVPVPNATWVPWRISAFLYHALGKYRIDRRRIYVIGGSGGGYGCYNIVHGANRLIAAIVPCPGYTKGWPVERFHLLTDVSIWAHTGNQDVGFRDSQERDFTNFGIFLGSSNLLRDGNPLAEIDRTAHWAGDHWEWTDGIGVTAPGGGSYPHEKHYSLFANRGHDTWWPAFGNQAMWDWMFRQIRPVTGAPGFDSTPPLTAELGVPYTYIIVATGTPAPTLHLTGAPSWLTLTGNILSGTPTTAGYTSPESPGWISCINLIARNRSGPDCERPFRICVSGTEPLTPPKITNTAPAVATVGIPYSYTIAATGYPAPVYQVTGNPEWLVLVGDVLSGTPTGAGPTGPITIRADNNGTHSNSQTFTIDVHAAAAPSEVRKSEP